MKIFEQVKIDTFYADIENDKTWNNFHNYILENASNVNIHKITEEELREFVLKEYGTLKVGGWSEAILINIISNVIYDIGKKCIKKIMKLVTKVGRQQATVISATEFGAGDVTINIKFKDGKKIKMNFPFAIESNEHIIAFDLTLLDKRLKKHQSVQLSFDAKRNKYKFDKKSVIQK